MKRTSSISSWHERSQCNPWCGEPECLHIDSLGGYPDLRHRTDAMIKARADSLGRIILAAALMLLFWYGFAHAHMGACIPSEVGLRVTVCDLYNHTQCISPAKLAKRVGWVVGRCQGEPTPCAPGTCPVDYSVCCTYANGSIMTAASVNECPKTFGGACLNQVVEAAKADPQARTCVPDDSDSTNAPLLAQMDHASSLTVLGTNVMRARIVGETTLLTNCEDTHTVACCEYAAGTTTVDDSCSNCPLTLGNTPFAGCQIDAFASGDGQGCVSNGP